MARLPLPAARSRYLTPGHIRFFRAAMEGVDLRRAWQYVELDEDEYSPALAKATVVWIRETTIGACLSTGHPELVGLFRRQSELVKVSAQPSLEEFIAQHEHGDAFSQVEMLALYNEKYALNPASERRSRLQVRLREAFDLLSKAIYRAPKASDSIAQWLAPQLVEHLQAAGMDSLADVRTALNRKKTLRWDEVPGVGEKWATRLTRWLDEHVIVVKPETGLAGVVASPFFGLGLSSSELKSTPAPLPALPFGSPTVASQITALVELSPSMLANAAHPLEGWAPYPASRNRIGACSDVHAIKMWLDAKAPMRAGQTRMTPTRRSYSRIAERFLLWCQLEANTTLPQFRVEHCIHYRTWLQDLGRKSDKEWSTAGWRIPAKEWIGRRGIERESALWRPFEGLLSKASVAQEITVLRALFKFLTDGAITSHNPWMLLGKASFNTAFSAKGNQFVSRSLTTQQRDYLLAGLDVEDEIDARLNLILWLGFGCALRASEMLALRFSDVAPDKWSLNVLGKGDKLRTVPLSSPVKGALLHYMNSIGIALQELVRASSGLDGDTGQEPILRTQRGRRKRDEHGNRVLTTPKQPMSYQSLNRVLKAHFEAKATALKASDPVGAARLFAASAHWLRHSCAVQASRNKVPLNGIQRLLGHSNISVTSGYLTDDDEALSKAMEAFLAPD